MHRQNAVFVRAGKGSLHPRWIEEDPQRTWDIIVNPWEDGVNTVGAEHVWFGGLMKHAAFALYANAEWLTLKSYDRVLLADDDVAFHPGGISRLFQRSEEFGLDISQPALEFGSWVNHPVTVRHPWCKVRFVTFVEIMVPLFSRQALAQLLPIFSEFEIDSGLDWRLAEASIERLKMGIVDAEPVRHTKRVDLTGGALYARLRELGYDPWKSLTDVRAAIKKPVSARTRFSRTIPGHNVPEAVALALSMMWELCIRGLMRVGLFNRFYFADSRTYGACLGQKGS